MLELYESYADYHTMMDIAEEMICEVLNKIKGSLIIEYMGQKLDFTS